MITSFVDESPTKKVLTIEVPADDVRKATGRATKAMAKSVRLPGFRPGKVPPELIRSRFAEEVKGEVVESLVKAALFETVEEKNLTMLGQPRISDLKFAFDEPLSFRVELEVRPEVDPKDYRGLKVPAGDAHVSPDEIDSVIRRFRESHATYDPIEGRAAQDGDFGLVDLNGAFPKGDGKDFRTEKTLVEIGGEGSMPELSAHLRNAEPGVTVTFHKDFPPDIPDRNFAGKTVLYTVHLVALKTRVLPAVDDELARLALTPREGEPPEGANLEMLREKVTESLKAEKEQSILERRRRAVLDGLLTLHDVPAPESMVESEVDSALKEFARHLTREGVELKDANVDWNQLRKEARPTAERRVKEYLLLVAIADKENIHVTDTELDADLKRRAQAMNMPFLELKSALLKAERIEGVREEVRIGRVLEFLLAEAAVAG
jgi:trigger factor